MIFSEKLQILRKNKGYTYRCKITGDFTWFQGYEEIYLNDTKVYECVFHGGIVN